jgi:uncharacterized protein
MNAANTTKSYGKKEQELLLKLVDDAIKYGIEHGKVMPVNPTDYPPHLAAPGACFVTLEIDGQLRGCIGSLIAHRPLVVDIAHNAFAAAFEDPRFDALTSEEYPRLTKHLSILSKPAPMSFTSEEDLLAQIRPNIDGLILSDNGYRGTFLPSVWEQLPEPKEFLQHLKMKAGLPPDYWSDTIKVERYTTEQMP